MKVHRFDFVGEVRTEPTHWEKLDRAPREPHDLCLFYVVKESFFIANNLPIQSVSNVNEFIELARKYEIGKHFHNETGPAYGAYYRIHSTNEKRYEVEQYYIDGKVIHNNEQIKQGGDHV